MVMRLTCNEVIKVQFLMGAYMPEAVCLNCSTTFKYKKGSSYGKFCSNSCQAKFKSNQLIEDWLAGRIDALSGNELRRTIVRWVKKRDSNSCVLCGWSEVNPVSGKIPVEVDHIDGDYMNNNPENLRTLCPNCHSLTPTWKNTGNIKGGLRGRSHRRKI